jgi:hypothetical protein
MFIRLTPNQIPKFWDAIKFASGNVAKVSEEDEQKFFNRLLINLLSDKVSCFVALDNERRLEWIFLLRKGTNEITGESVVVIDCMYSFVRKDDEEYRKIFNLFIDFAKSNKCKNINMWTNVDRVIEISSMLGFEKKYELFSYPIGR